MASIKSYKKLFGTTLIFSSIKKNRGDFLKYLKQLNFTNFDEHPIQLWKNIYNKVLSDTRYEYVYKNEMLRLFYNDIMREKKLLLNEVELYSNNIIHNILDLLIISNDELHAIEIKSDFDTFQRLDNQLPMYCKLFQYVSVFVSDYKVSMVEQYMDNIGFDNVGIISLDNNNVTTIRPPKSNEDLLDKDLLLENIKIKSPFTKVQLDRLEDIYSFWFSLLQNDFKLDNEFVSSMPDPLKFYAFSHNYLPSLKRQRLINYFKKMSIIK